MTSARTHTVCFLTATLFSPPVFATDQPSNIEQAIAFLRTACVTSGSSTALEIVGTENGSFQLKDPANKGNTTITLTRKELEGLADSASAFSAKQATEMRNCMQPHIDKIITAMLTGNATGFPNAQSIETDGYPFVTAEFDVVISFLATKPFDRWPFADLTRSIKLHPARVRHYLELAIKNGMAEPQSFPSMEGACPCYEITDKGTAYVIARGLAQN